MSENDLPYMIMDADNHFTEPPNVFENYIDPSKKDLAVRFVQDSSGQRLQLFAGKPSKYNSKQTVYSAEALEKMLGQPLNELAGEGKSDESVNQLIPGMLLNRIAGSAVLAMVSNCNPLTRQWFRISAYRRIWSGNVGFVRSSGGSLR